MEDAKITDTTNINPNEKQSLISVDDLIMEIGKQHVDKMNNDRILNLLVKRNNELLSSTSNSQEVKTSLEEQVKSITASNKLYKANNKELDKSLVLVHKEKSELNKDLKNTKIELEELEIKFSVKDKDYENKRIEVIGLETRLQNIEKKTEVKKLKSNRKNKK